MGHSQGGHFAMFLAFLIAIIPSFRYDNATFSVDKGFFARFYFGDSRICKRFGICGLVFDDVA